jgi:branched-chain amino acid transport system substrate-binding protein
VLVAVAAIVGGCGSGQRPGNRVRGKVLTIYFSGPTQGASSPAATAALNGARLALAEAHSRVGSYQIRLSALDDATPQSHGWDPNQATLNARLATQDPTTIGYLGDFNSGASAISIPLLNRVGIPQLSPGSTTVGLTTAGTGASPGEPAKYYPTGTRTFARVVPTDADQAATIVQAEQEIGCHSTFVLQDEEFDGEDAALTFLLTAHSAELRVIAVQAFQPQATDYTGLARSVAASGADCVLISAIDENGAARLTEQVAAAVPRATILATNGLADSAYTDPLEGGIPTSLDPRVLVVSATLPPSAYPRTATAMLNAYDRQFGSPEPPALFGYEAMKLMLAAISRATDGGRKPAERSKVLSALFSSRVGDSTLGSFRIDSAGDTTDHRFAVYRLIGGRLVPWAEVGQGRGTGLEFG